MNISAISRRHQCRYPDRNPFTMIARNETRSEASHTVPGQAALSAAFGSSARSHFVPALLVPVATRTAAARPEAAPRQPPAAMAARRSPVAARWAAAGSGTGTAGSPSNGGAGSAGIAGALGVSGAGSSSGGASAQGGSAGATTGASAGSAGTSTGGGTSGGGSTGFDPCPATGGLQSATARRLDHVRHPDQQRRVTASSCSPKPKQTTCT